MIDQILRNFTMRIIRETLMLLDHVRCGIIKRSYTIDNIMSLLTDIMSWDTILTRGEMEEIERICSRPRWQWGASSDHTAPHKKFWKMDVKGYAIFDSDYS